MQTPGGSQDSTAENALIARARVGDREAFAQLYAPLERPLAAYLYRLTAARQDAEDLAQETALKALETIGELTEAASFRVWIFRIATGAALEYLRVRRTWDPDAQIRAGRRAAESPPARRRLQQLHNSVLNTTYRIREHIDFCFMLMGRTLPPHEQAALLLAELHGLGAEEAAATLGISVQTLQFRLQQARQTLVDQFDSRCGLINKDGLCTLCAGLDTLLHKNLRHTEQALFELELVQQPTAAGRAATFPQRLAIVRSIDPLHAEGTRLHEFLAALAREANGYD